MFLRCLIVCLCLVPCAAYSAETTISGVTYSIGALDHIDDNSRFILHPYPSDRGFGIESEGVYFIEGSFLCTYVYSHQVPGSYTLYYDKKYYSFSIVQSPDSDGDGLEDQYDPCPDSADTNLSVYRAKNTQTGSYYFFQITGDCGQTLTYINPIYDSLDSAAQAWASDPDPVGSADRTAMSPASFQSWMGTHSGTVSSPTSTPPDSDPVMPDPTGSTTPETVPPVPQSNDENTQDIINQIERMKSSLDNSINNSANKIANQVDLTGKQIISALKGVGGTSASMSGVESRLGDIKGTISTGNSEILTALSGVEGAISALGESLEGLGNGTEEEGPDLSSQPEFDPGTNSTFEPVSEDRVSASKEAFYQSVNDLIDSYSGLFEPTLGGSASLPVWNWSILGHSITLDFNIFSEELNWLGLGVMLIASISAVFIVLD